MTNTLELFMIPTASRWLVYPKAMTKYVYPYAPSLSVENASEFVMGSMLINNMIIPILDLDFDHQRDEREGSEGLRIVMIDTIFAEAKYPNYALLSYGEPKAVTCEASMIEKIDVGDHRYLAQKVLIKDERLENKSCFIPNLLSFESELKMR